MDISEEDKEMLLVSIRKKGFPAFFLASDIMRDNEEFALKAVMIDGGVFQYISDRLRDDERIALEAIMRRPFMLCYASKRLRSDPAFMNECYKISPTATKVNAMGDLIDHPEEYIDYCYLKPAKN